MVKYLLVEDERFAYEELKRMMQRLRPSWQLAGWAESVEQEMCIRDRVRIGNVLHIRKGSNTLHFSLFRIHGTKLTEMCIRDR